MSGEATGECPLPGVAACETANQILVWQNIESYWNRANWEDAMLVHVAWTCRPGLTAGIFESRPPPRQSHPLPNHVPNLDAGDRGWPRSSRLELDPMLDEPVVISVLLAEVFACWRKNYFIRWKTGISKWFCCGYSSLSSVHGYVVCDLGNCLVPVPIFIRPQCVHASISSLVPFRCSSFRSCICAELPIKTKGKTMH